MAWNTELMHFGWNGRHQRNVALGGELFTLRHEANPLSRTSIPSNRRLPSSLQPQALQTMLCALEGWCAGKTGRGPRGKRGTGDRWSPGFTDVDAFSSIPQSPFHEFKPSAGHDPQSSQQSNGFSQIKKSNTWGQRTVYHSAQTH